jgi:hypothetical protein
MKSWTNNVLSGTLDLVLITVLEEYFTSPSTKPIYVFPYIRGTVGYNQLNISRKQHMCMPHASKYFFPTVSP